MSEKSYGQNEANVWYFGYHAGIDFSSGVPIVLSNGQTETLEGVGSICDSNGLLLFYTNGVNIWNSQHQVMPNGSGLFGGLSSTQSAIIVPKVGDNSRYYVFTVDEWGGADGLRYSIVNINLDNGKGDVELKNIPLLSPVCEKITAVKHCNGRDIWVITHGWNSDAYYSFLISPVGVSVSPVISNAGTFITGNIDATIGYLKASPDGKKIAAAHHLQGLELLDFNNVTGTISNPISLFLPNENYSNPYGVEFSPNSKLLYVTVSDYYLNVSQHRNWLLQYDISLPNTPAIIASKKIIYIDNAPVQTFGGLQMGPNGRMYMVGETLQGISEIDFPDSSGIACQFNLNEIPVGNGQVCHYGLPSFIQSYWEPSFTFSELCSGQSMNFLYSRPAHIISVKWDFGDPPSGADNISFLDNPSHTFTSPGQYAVKLIRFTNCGSDTLEKLVQIGPPDTVLGRDTTFCGINNYQLNTNLLGNYTFLWQNGSNAPTYTANQSGLYWVEIINNQSGCTKRDSILITFNSYPSFSLGNDTTLCQGQSLVLTASLQGSSYLWNTGNNTDSQVVNSSGIYWVDVTTNGCTKRDSVYAVANLAPIISLGGDTTVCEDQNLLLDAGNFGSSYQWQDNSSNQTYLVSDAGSYWAKVVLNGCSASDTINIGFDLKPVFSIGKDTSICEGMTIQLQPIIQNPQGVSYIWNNGAITSSIAITKTGTYNLTATNSCGSNNDEIIITKGICKLYVPSAFTPNNDGLNDIFRVSAGENISEFKMQVYNRWGQIVFETNDIHKGWDGKINGLPQPNGIYVWLIKYKTINKNNEQIMKGTVMLIK